MQQYANQSVAPHLRGKAKFAFSVLARVMVVCLRPLTLVSKFTLSALWMRIWYSAYLMWSQSAYSNAVTRCIQVGYGTQKRKLPPWYIPGAAHSSAASARWGQIIMFTFATETKVYPSPLSRLYICKNNMCIILPCAANKTKRLTFSHIYWRKGKRAFNRRIGARRLWYYYRHERVREMWQVTELWLITCEHTMKMVHVLYRVSFVRPIKKTCESETRTYMEEFFDEIN